MFETAHATRHVSGATEKKGEKNKGAKRQKNQGNRQVSQPQVGAFQNFPGVSLLQIVYRYIF